MELTQKQHEEAQRMDFNGVMNLIKEIIGISLYDLSANPNEEFQQEAEWFLNDSPIIQTLGLDSDYLIRSYEDHLYDENDNYIGVSKEEKYPNKNI